MRRIVAPVAQLGQSSRFLTERSGVQILPGAFMPQISEGLRMFFRSVGVRVLGFHKYAGDAKQICEQIISDC